MPPELVDATDLDRLADRLEMRGLLPHLVRRLLGGTPGVRGLDIPAEEGVSAQGFDGVIDGGPGSAWVPAGSSVWEMGAGQDAKGKAQKDYETRTANPLGISPAETTFVFVTPRRWDGREWATARHDEGIWHDVKVLNADSLHAWLEATPDVHVWLSERLGFQPLSVRTLSRAFEVLAARTRPALPGALLLAGREQQVDALRAALSGPASVIPVRAGSREEGVAFMAAALHLDALDLDRAPDQPLLVRDASAFERLTLAERPLQLVAAIDGLELGDAATHGHHVLLALGPGDFDRSGQIALPRPPPRAAREALEAAGIQFEQAERLAALARRSFAALLREMSATQAGARPSWATGRAAPRLAALLLLGGWVAGPGDDDVIESVTGHTRAEIEELLAPFAASEDPPWTRTGGGWRLVSADDGFALVGELLADELLARWRRAAEEVLCEMNPRVGMDSGERMLADLRREALSQFSAPLRHGLAEAAALLGARGADALPTGAVPADHAAGLVTDVLRVANEEQTGALWRSLDDVLPMLAEAAPDAFLDGVRDGMDLDPSPILTLFAEGQNDTFSHPPHTGLLWALEKIAWSSRHLTRVTLILGELAHSDPRRGRWTNRPSNTLRSTFLAWFPNTDADLPGRLAALDALRDRWPDMSWELLLAILPHRQTIGSHSSKPRFRDWGLEWSPTSPEELIETIRALASRIADDAGGNGSRWAEVVPHLSELPPNDRAMLFERIGSLDPTGMHPDERLSMWNALVNEGERHLRFPDADWSLDRTKAAIFVEAAERFQDENLPEREARLFDFRVRLPDLPQGDFEAQERGVAERRDHAAESVFERDGLDGLLRLADASAQPRLVGIAAAARRDDPADGLLPLLGGEGPGAAVAAGWAARRTREEGIEWAKQQLDAARLDVDGQTALMLELPGDDTTWDALEDLSAEVQAKYWRAATPFRLQSQQVSRVVAKLLEVGRPWAAVDVLAGCAHDSVALDADVVEQALLEAARSDQVDAAIHAAWEVGQLLDALEADGLPLVRLATLEFTYFALLGDVRHRARWRRR